MAKGAAMTLAALARPRRKVWGFILMEEIEDCYAKWVNECREKSILVPAQET